MSGRAAQSEWVGRVLGVVLSGAPQQSEDGFADLGELGLDELTLWRAARQAYDAANESVDAQITALVAALRDSNDPDYEKVADMGLNALTENVKVPLIAALLDAGTESLQSVAAARPKIESAITAFRSKITTDPRILACDTNPLGVAVDIGGSFGDALDQLEDALSIVH